MVTNYKSLLEKETDILVPAKEIKITVKIICEVTRTEAKKTCSLKLLDPVVRRV